MSALPEAAPAGSDHLAVEGPVEIDAVGDAAPWTRPVDAIVVPADGEARFGARGQAFLDALEARGVPPATITDAVAVAWPSYGRLRLVPVEPLAVPLPAEVRAALPGGPDGAARLLLVATGLIEGAATLRGAAAGAAGALRAARDQGCRSMIVPLLNAGVDALPAAEVASATLAAVREELRGGGAGSLAWIGIVGADRVPPGPAPEELRLVRTGLSPSEHIAVAVVQGRPVAVVPRRDSAFVCVDLGTGDDIGSPLAAEGSPVAVATVRGLLSTVVTGWSDGMVRAWDLTTGEAVAEVGPWYESGQPLSAAAIGDSIYVASIVEGRARSLRLAAEPDARTHGSLGTDATDPVVFAVDGTPVVAAIDRSVTPERIVRSYLSGDVEAGPPIMSAVPGFFRLIVGGSPDAPVLVARTGMGYIERWNGATGKALPASIKRDSRHFAADETSVVIAGDDDGPPVLVGDSGPLLRFDLATGQPIGGPLERPRPVRAMPMAIAAGGGAVAALDTAGDLWAWTGERQESPPAPSPWRQPNPTVARDYWTTEDNLGYQAYARAIAEFVTHEKTRPPLTIGIKGPWGAGKTSVMRMVQRLLDPPIDPGASEWTFRELTLNREGRELLARGGDADGDALGETTVKTVLRRAAEAPMADLDLSRPVTAEPSAVRRPTVWFNPWMYQTGEQVWAGLAHEIITQVTGRLPWRQRERFWLELNLRRINREALRHKIHVLVFQKVLVPLVVFAIGVTFTVLLALAGVWAGWLAASVAPAAVGAGWAVGMALKLLNRDAAAAVPWIVEGPIGLPGKEDLVKEVGSWSDVVSEPDYQSRAGFLYFLQTDMKHVLDLVATPTRPLVVFIDDLDRCSPGVVTQTIEAVNLFLAGAFPNCIFVLAIEPAVVAAHIETVHKDLVARLEKVGAPSGWSELGWRFLEKIVQLPLALPQPKAGVAGDFVQSLFGTVESRDAHDRIATAVESQLARLEAQAPQAPELAAIPVERAQVEDEARQDGFDDATARRIADDVAIRRFARSFTDDDAQVRQVIVEEALALPSRNPREMKRLVNLFRFYTLIVNERRILVEAASQAEVFAQVARLAALANRWPHLLSAFGALGLSGAADDEQRPIALESLEKAASGSDPEWAEALAECGLARAGGPGEPDGLRQFLRSGTTMGVVARELL